jgi:hypothetical protein
VLYRQWSSGSKGFGFEIALIAAVVDPRIVRASYRCDAVTVTGSAGWGWIKSSPGCSRGLRRFALIASAIRDRLFVLL